MTKTIELPSVHQRACELPGGPLIAIMTALKDHVAKILDKRRPSMGLDDTNAIRRAIGTAATMYWTPRREYDVECYAVEIEELCMAILYCGEACHKAIKEAAKFEEGEEEKIRYSIRVLAPPGADLDCLSVLDPEQINVEVKCVERKLAGSDDK